MEHTVPLSRLLFRHGAVTLLFIIIIHSPHISTLYCHNKVFVNAALSSWAILLINGLKCGLN